MPRLQNPAATHALLTPFAFPNRHPKFKSPISSGVHAAARKNEASPEMDLIQSMLKAFEECNKELQPLFDFHRAIESAKDDDLRMFWDVRIVQGKNTPFASIRSSSMPKALGQKMAPSAPSNIEKEVIQKIIEPLMGIVMHEVERPFLKEPSEQ